MGWGWRMGWFCLRIGWMGMSDLWLYTPEICDGDYCPLDCDKCYKADAVMGVMEEDEEDG